MRLTLLNVEGRPTRGSKLSGPKCPTLRLSHAVSARSGGRLAVCTTRGCREKGRRQGAEAAPHVCWAPLAPACLTHFWSWCGTGRQNPDSKLSSGKPCNWRTMAAKPTKRRETSSSSAATAPRHSHSGGSTMASARYVAVGAGAGKGFCPPRALSVQGCASVRVWPTRVQGSLFACPTVRAHQLTLAPVYTGWGTTRCDCIRGQISGQQDQVGIVDQHQSSGSEPGEACCPSKFPKGGFGHK